MKITEPNANLQPQKVKAKITDNIFKNILKATVTDEMVQDIESLQFAWLKTIVQGHVVIICAESNGGKTTIMAHAAAEMVKNGYEVMYINADAAADQLKEYKGHATRSGYTLLSPDMSSEPVGAIVTYLNDIAASDSNLSNIVIILDTLKKFTDVMSKGSAKSFYSMCRTLSAKGATVICLAHTNKYKANDGMPVFEGVGDLRNDCDELIYLIPVKNDDGSMTVSTVIGKARASLEKVSFRINADRSVEVLSQHVDTHAISIYQDNLKSDGDIIAFILENISSKPMSVTELKDIACYRFSRKVLEKVLVRYCYGSDCLDPKWRSIPAKLNGTKYEIL